MFQTITEGKAKISVPIEKKISKELPVFFNPVMKFNRDTSILLLKAIENKDMQIALPMAASGIRGIRFLLELKKEKIKNITFNDYSDIALDSIKKNLKLNDLASEKIIISKKDANLFLMESSGFDYIDIDPFGSPNFLLDNAVKRISRDGILAVTATDTSALAGTYPKATARKYDAKPLRNEFMHETAIRILIRKIQVIAAQYDKALTPIFSFSKDHYYRIFFRCKKGKTKVDTILEQHGYIIYCRKCLKKHTTTTILNQNICDCGNTYEYGGPLWLGKLWDTKLTKAMHKQTEDLQIKKILNTILDESKIYSFGYYNIPHIAKIYKIPSLPKIDYIIDKIIKKGFLASQTHFSDNCIKTDSDTDELIETIKKTLNNQN